MSAVDDYLEDRGTAHLGELRELLRIPSISTDPRRREAMIAAAAWLRRRLERAGCTGAEIRETPGHPLVYGEWLGAPGRPTLLVYGHYDVQPVEPLELWSSPPFEPTERDGALFARGATDDKGQLIVHIDAFEAHLATAGSCPVNVRFLIEGEEEIGSPGLEPFVRAHRDELACDAVVISDSAMHSRTIPAICHALRGIVALEIDVIGADRDLHSGDHGGALINPAQALATMLATLKDDRGRILVDGFYDDLRPPGAAELESVERQHAGAPRRYRALGVPRTFGESGYSDAARLTLRPTLDINGMCSGHTGEGTKTIIPARAQAKLSLRLVPDQDPAGIGARVVRHLETVAPSAVRVELRLLHTCAPWVAATDSPVLRAACRSLRRIFGHTPVFTRGGGSIGIVPAFQRHLGAPVVLMGFGLPDDNAHAPNEKIELELQRRGRHAAARFMQALADAEGAPSA